MKIGSLATTPASPRPRRLASARAVVVARVSGNVILAAAGEPGAGRPAKGAMRARPVAKVSMQRVSLAMRGLPFSATTRAWRFGQLADFGAVVRMGMSAGNGALERPDCQVAGDADGAEEVGDLLVERDVLDPPNSTRVLVRAPSTARACARAEDLGELGSGLAAQMNEIPRARSLAIRVCRVGSGAGDGSSSR